MCGVQAGRIAGGVIGLVAGLAGLPMAGSAQQTAAGTRPLAIEDYYRIQTIMNPRISPDGRWVLFSIAHRVEEDNSTHSEVQLVPSDASAPPRRVLHEGQDVTNPRWTDESRVVYSIAGSAWSVDPAHPTAAPAKADTLTAGAVRSPDRRWIALTRDKERARAEPSDRSAFERRHEERFRGVTFDWKDFQRDGAAFPAPNLRARPPAQLVVRSADGGEPRVLADLDLRPDNVTWHSGGRLLAFTGDPAWRDELTYESPELWLVTTEGKVTQLTDDAYVYGSLGFSPDGKYLSYLRTYGTDMVIAQRLSHGGARDLFVRPVDGGEPINLTAHWDLEPEDPRWAPDGRFLYFTSETAGEIHLFRAAVPSGTVDQVTQGPRRLTGLTIDRRFTTIAYTVGVHEAPADLYAASLDGTHERRLTDLHGAFRQISLTRAERVRWPSPDGTEIEGWLLPPAGFDPAKGLYPLIVTSHGGPHAATGYLFDFKKQFFAANGYFVLDVNFRGSTGYGDAFKWATWGEWGRKDGEDVMSGVDYVLRRYPVDSSRVGHTGHSYGGFLTNWLITQYPDRLAAAITGAGISNWISDYGTADIYRTKETEFYGTPWEPEARERMIRQSPLTYAGRVRTPTLFVHGEVDQRVPYEEAEQMYFALKRRGVPARMIVYAGQPHSIGGHWNNIHRMLNELRWWDTYLGRTPAKAGAVATPTPR